MIIQANSLQNALFWFYIVRCQKKNHYFQNCKSSHARGNNKIQLFKTWFLDLKYKVGKVKVVK